MNTKERTPLPGALKIMAFLAIIAAALFLFGGRQARLGEEETRNVLYIFATLPALIVLALGYLEKDEIKDYLKERFSRKEGPSERK